MKWFRHISDSMHDPDIFSITEKFGNDGYAVFFGCLEFMTRNYNQQSADKSFTFPEKLLRKTFRISAQKLRNILTFAAFSKRIVSKIEGDIIILQCPKLDDMIENYGRQIKYRETKKLRNGYVTVTKKLHTEVEVDKKENKETTLSGKPDPIPFSEIIAYLNEKLHTSYKEKSKDTHNHIRARWNEGFRLEDFKKVIDQKSNDWLADSKMVEFLRPKTLFGTKFESYLNKPEGSNNGKTENNSRIRS